MAIIFVKCVHEPVKKTDGFRVLTDRLWPRGYSIEVLHADAWMKELAPSPCLRIWFKHHPEQWAAFSSSYLVELKVYADIAALQSFCKAHKKITLLHASKDELHNHAVILRDFLDKLQNASFTAMPYCSN